LILISAESKIQSPHSYRKKQDLEELLKTQKEKEAIYDAVETLGLFPNASI